MMKINMVVVDKNVDRGIKAGRDMAQALRKAEYAGWEMHVHVRLPESLTTDDAYARYTP